jgi:hypothetical protein
MNPVSGPLSERRSGYRLPTAVVVNFSVERDPIHFNAAGFRLNLGFRLFSFFNRLSQLTV